MSSSYIGNGVVLSLKRSLIRYWPSRCWRREAHRAELAVHAAGEPAVGVDPAAEPVARLEDGDRVAGFLEEQPGGQAGHPGPDDDDVLLRPVELREPGAQRFQQVESVGHG